MATPTAVLHSQLLELHRTLLELVKVEYERGHGKVANASALLQLVIHDEAFAWLRPLSKLLVDLDDKDVIADASAARAAVEGLFATATFADAYQPALQAHPDLSFQHGEVMRITKGLPEKSSRLTN